MANETRQVWQNDNGTWSHCKDRHGEFPDRECAETDLRFCNEWGR